jgi:hypothetical protein
MKTAVEIKKLHLIEDLLRVESERIIDRIESILKEERLKTLETELNRPYTEKEFNEMIDRSELNVTEGKVLSTKDLKKKVQSWK